MFRLLCFIFISYNTNALECYVCSNENQTTANQNCMANVTVCSFQDAYCFAQVTANKDSGNQIGFYNLSKGCAPANECRNEDNSTQFAILRSECCQQDRCNNYTAITDSADISPNFEWATFTGRCIFGIGVLAISVWVISYLFKCIRGRCCAKTAK